MRSGLCAILGLAMLTISGCGGCQPGEVPEDAVTDDTDVKIGDEKSGKEITSVSKEEVDPNEEAPKWTPPPTDPNAAKGDPPADPFDGGDIEVPDDVDLPDDLEIPSDIDIEDPTGEETTDGSDGDAPKREAAPAGGIAALVEQLSDDDARDAAADALQEKGVEAVPELLALLESDDPAIRSGAVFALGEVGPAAEQALPALKKIAEHDDDEVVAAAAKFAIGIIAGGEE
jgi:hypothetical protein